MGVTIKSSTEELRVKNEEFCYAFLLEKLLFTVRNNNMTTINQSIAEQCKQSLFTLHSSLFTKNSTRNFS